MPKLKIFFCNDIFKTARILITKLLKDEFELIETACNPDVVFCSIFGKQYKKYKCKKICFIGENCFPDFNKYDYVVSPHYIEFSRHLRIPYYAMTIEY